VRSIVGGFLVQTPDDLPEQGVAFRTVSAREPSPEERRDLAFAWRAVKHVKSNAIVLARETALVGVGAGQMSRVDSVDIAVRKSLGRHRGAVLASDAMIPFADGAELAAEAGVTAIVQPGGSIRDHDVIAVADRYRMAMVFTGTRHFRH
jgi:phosphoribosylaminoimidazolecarboxamide formyltransferase/IMP cyclohydrolase